MAKLPANLQTAINNDSNFKAYLADNRIDINIFENPLIGNLDNIIKLANYCLDNPSHSQLLKFIINDVLPVYRITVLQNDPFSQELANFYSPYRQSNSNESQPQNPQNVDSLLYQLNQAKEKNGKLKKENEQLKFRIEQLEKAQKDSNIQGAIQSFNQAKKCMSLNLEKSAQMAKAYTQQMKIEQRNHAKKVTE